MAADASLNIDANIDVDIERVSKRFGAVAAVDDVTLQIRRGEFFSLLGPSGCGKTTLLRMIAGLELPTSGMLRIDGRAMTHEPAHRRPVNMVFQHYALFPHLSVEKNVGFGLRYVKGDPARFPEGIEPARLIDEALALVRLQGLGKRKPHELSGGQRQRVALARALVLRPRVLLLDEPLGALDQKLRKEMQVELKTLQRELGLTFVFVTHDQEEALTMSDRIAVMNAGKVEQLDEAAKVFESPRTAFVATFMGAGNFFEAKFESKSEFKSATAHRFIVRPEKLTLHAQSPAGKLGLSVLPVTIEQRIYQGVSTLWNVRGPGNEAWTVYEQNDRPFVGEAALLPGAKAWLAWDPAHAIALHEPTRG
ncbi:MAG: ABC transporter ATP-binding protein [Planctomycetota bacterium]|nr:ABC transporter ATP-binding protein [Planctomycetota bacterium]